MVMDPTDPREADPTLPAANEVYPNVSWEELINDVPSLRND